MCMAANGQGELSAAGLSIAAVLVVIYFLLNFWSVKVFAGTNSAITFFKLIVPAATAIALLCTGFHPGNFHIGVHGGVHVGTLGIDAHGSSDQRDRLQLQRFSKPRQSGRRGPQPRPQRTLRHLRLDRAQHRGVSPAARWRFSARWRPEHLHEGWAALEYSSPFAQLALALNLNWLAILLYADAFVSPSGTGTPIRRPPRA